MSIKVLHLDIETAPNLTHVWGLFKQNIGLNQIIESGYVLCWAAKWDQTKNIFYSSIEGDGQEGMLTKIHELLDEADVVVHYNGCRFDIPTLNREFILMHMTPPSTYKQVDLLRTCKTQFNFPSNKLAYVSQALGIGQKVKHYGHELWIECMNHDQKAWKTMEKYNKMDVLLTEKLYHKLIPWIKSHPNHNLFTDGGEMVCTNCGNNKLHRKGKVFTNAGVYKRYRCTGCGANMRGRLTQISKEARENLVVGVT